MHLTVSRMGEAKPILGSRGSCANGERLRVGLLAFCDPTHPDDEAIGMDGAPGMLAGSGGVMPTVISKMGPERVRRSVVPRTSPRREAMSPG